MEQPRDAPPKEPTARALAVFARARDSARRGLLRASAWLRPRWRLVLLALAAMLVALGIVLALTKSDAHTGPLGPATSLPAATEPSAPHVKQRLSGQRKLSGRVLDDRNQPLVDAQIRVSSLDDADALPWEARSDREGRFTFTDLVPHALVLEVTRAGHDGSERSLRADDAGELTFVLARQGELLVALRDVPGQSVEGTLVTLTGPGLWPAAELRVGTSGEVLFENLAFGEYRARARREGRAAPASDKIRVVPGERARLSLTLGAAHTLHAILLDRSTRAPIAGATLSAYDPTPGIAPREAKSDARGALSLAGLLPGELRLELRHQGHAPRSLDVKIPLAEPLQVELDGEASVSGMVVDERGRPISGALLSVATRDGLPIALETGAGTRVNGSGELGVTRGPVPKIPLESSPALAIGTLASQSDAQGAFRVAGLAPSPIVLSAAHAGYAEGSVEVLDLAPHQERRDVRIVLRQAGRVEGTIQDARGHAVGGVYVSAHMARSEHSAITDAAGHFALIDVLGELTVSAEAQGYAPLACKLSVQAGQTARCDLTVGSTLYELPVRVLDDFGFGLEGVVISVSTKSTPRIFTQVSRRDGGAVLRELPEPPYQLSASLSGFVTTAVDVLEPERELRIKLLRAASLAGTVTDSLGRPVPSAMVSTDEGDATGSTDENGSFLLTGITPGALYVMAAHQSVGEGVSAQVRARAGETLASIRVVLPGRYLPGAQAHDAESREPSTPASAARVDKDSGKLAPRIKPPEFELEQRGRDVIFADVSHGGAAERAGVRGGDVLVSIDGEPVLSAAQGRGMLRDPPGLAANLRLLRERTQLRLRYRRPGL